MKLIDIDMSDRRSVAMWVDWSPVIAGRWYNLHVEGGLGVGKQIRLLPLIDLQLKRRVIAQRVPLVVSDVNPLSPVIWFDY